MGTNYYAYFAKDVCTVCGGSGEVTTTECPHCGQPHEETVECGECYGVGYEMEYHIGKSSAGWVFSLRGHPVGCGASLNGIHSWPVWKEILQQPGVTIRDEYRQEITLECLTEVVENRAWPDRDPEASMRPYRSLREYMKRDGLELTEQMLLRRKSDEPRDRTWQVFYYEFS